MQSIELAWAAGFFDGEGYVGSVRRRPGPRGGRWSTVLAMEVTQVDVRLLIDPQPTAAAKRCSGRSST